MSRLGQQMFFARKRSANVAAAEGFVCAKAQRQQQHDVGHGGVITECDAFSSVPLLLILKESPSLHSNQLKYMAWP
ncbi:hypothetical protein B1B04_22910 [Lysinibacillus sp. KCTC 33748]|nr:hypothetical protein B1B04_22910 [Lysinibacillus sp. KCTC 33748]SKC15675.1 hypothetical protein SAMN06295926_13014 [Lysinibacillus sp. AC-3]